MNFKKIVFGFLFLTQIAFAEVAESTESEEEPPARNGFTDTIRDLTERITGKPSEKPKNKVKDKTIEKTNEEAGGQAEIKENESSTEVETPAETKTVVRTRTSPEVRADRSLSVGINWNLISMWIPNKLGANIQYNYSEGKTIAAEYQSQGYKAAVFDFKFGEIKESKYGVLLKSFGTSNSFYLAYGLMRYQLKAELGTDLFGPVSLPFAPLFDVSSLGFQFGMGNQWNWDNGFTLGIEWFSVYLHTFGKNKNTEIFEYLNPSDRDKANKVVDLIYNLPVLELLKIQLNYSF